MQSLVQQGDRPVLVHDGKADKGMAHVALNCLPANMENASHTKS